MTRKRKNEVVLALIVAAKMKAALLFKAVIFIEFLRTASDRDFEQQNFVHSLLITE